MFCHPQAEAYYDYRDLIHSPENLVHNNTNSVDSRSLTPDDKDSLVSSENLEHNSTDLSEPMEVDAESKCSESRTDEVTAFGDKDMVGSSEKTEDGFKEDENSETAEISKHLSETVGKPESGSRIEKAIDLEPPPVCELHVVDSGDIEPMADDEIAGESESRIGEENDAEAFNSTNISEEKAEKGRKNGSLEASNNACEEDAPGAKPRVDDCNTIDDAGVELEITYDEKLESTATEITVNGTAECTTDSNRDIATDGAEKLEGSTSKLNNYESGEDTDGSAMNLGALNGGSEPVVAHDKDHGESADKPERVIKLVTYSKRKPSDKKHTVDSSDDPQQKINEAVVDSKTNGALHSVPNDS